MPVLFSVGNAVISIFGNRFDISLRNLIGFMNSLSMSFFIKITYFVLILFGLMLTASVCSSSCDSENELIVSLGSVTSLLYVRIKGLVGKYAFVTLWGFLFRDWFSLQEDSGLKEGEFAEVVEAFFFVNWFGGDGCFFFDFFYCLLDLV